jgi:CHASE2 domain-containing sensor protein
MTLIQGKKSPWRWAVEPTSIIDFAWLDRIRDEVEYHVDPAPYRDDREKIANRIILLGDTNPKECDPQREEDCFHVTGVRYGVRGVFLHACAANTIAAGKPIYQLTLLGRIAVDGALGLLIFGLVEFSRSLHSRFTGSLSHVQYRSNLKLTFLAIFLVFVVSVVLVRWTRLLWTDFLLVCLVLLVQLVVDIFNARQKSRKPQPTERQRVGN